MSYLNVHECTVAAGVAAASMHATRNMKGKKNRAMVSFAAFLIGLHAIKILTWVFRAAKMAAGRRSLDTGTLLMSILLLN
jgi:hypothetical protein